MTIYRDWREIAKIPDTRLKDLVSFADESYILEGLAVGFPEFFPNKPIDIQGVHIQEIKSWMKKRKINVWQKEYAPPEYRYGTMVRCNLHHVMEHFDIPPHKHLYPGDSRETLEPILGTVIEKNDIIRLDYMGRECVVVGLGEVSIGKPYEYSDKHSYVTLALGEFFNFE